MSSDNGIVAAKIIERTVESKVATFFFRLAVGVLGVLILGATSWVLATLLEVRDSTIVQAADLGHIKADIRLIQEAQAAERDKSDGQITGLQSVDQQFRLDIAALQASLINFKRRVDTAICQHWPSNCEREP